MRIPHIPPDLIHEILAHLSRDKQALESCSLVCKAWVHPSRSHLFAEVLLHNSRFKRFFAFGQRSDVIPYIRFLHLRQQSMLGRNALWDECIPDFTGFERVRSLKLSWFTSHDLSSQAQAAIFTAFTGIARLTLVGLHHLDEALFAKIICSFLRLEVLTLGSVFLQWSTSTSGQHAVPPRVSLRHLHTLEISGDNAIKLLAWILSFQNLPALRALHLDGCSGDPKTLNDSLLDLRSLERLSLFNTHPTFGFIDLRHQEHLRSLRIKGIPSWYPTRHAIQTLTSVTSECMHELIFDVMESPDAENDTKWNEVDAILQSRRFSNLRTVQVNIITSRSLHGPPSCAEPKLSTAFPVWLCQCHARGILSVQRIMYVSALNFQFSST